MRWAPCDVLCCQNCSLSVSSELVLPLLMACCSVAALPSAGCCCSSHSYILPGRSGGEARDLYLASSPLDALGHLGGHCWSAANQQDWESTALVAESLGIHAHLQAGKAGSMCWNEQHTHSAVSDSLRDCLLLRVCECAVHCVKGVTVGCKVQMLGLLKALRHWNSSWGVLKTLDCRSKVSASET